MKTLGPPNTKIDTTPFFIASYGEGDFLISLIWINDSAHEQQMKDLLKNAIPLLTMTRVKRRFVDKDRT